MNYRQAARAIAEQNLPSNKITWTPESHGRWAHSGPVAQDTEALDRISNEILGRATYYSTPRKGGGLGVTFEGTTESPYQSVDELVTDVRKNRRFRFKMPDDA